MTENNKRPVACLSFKRHLLDDLIAEVHSIQDNAVELKFSRHFLLNSKWNKIKQTNIKCEPAYFIYNVH